MAAKKILVIVESPSKAKTIGKFLGGHYKVMASVGHVRDLPKSKLGIDLENNFEPQYISIRGKGEIIKELKKEAKNASKVYLATDPDREGEAISWHLAFLLGIDITTPCRIVFNEITEKTIKAAIRNPRPIDVNLVDAQQARRVLDRLVGYQISPLLWRKVRRGLSAGRVQSAALKMLCNRENEIKNFKSDEFWIITAEFEKERVFTAKLTDYKGKKIVIGNEDENNNVLEQLKKGKYIVRTIEEKDRLRKTPPPFTTSSLQQDAANKLNFSTRKTMMVAQQLYEGIEIKGRGTVGLVSYIRTDSVRISDEAREAAREYIMESIGQEYYGGTVYTNKKKDVQDAHEAIRPSYADLEPDSIKDSVTKDQYNLYKLIWNRFIASQMTPARYKAVNAVIDNGDYAFKATGSKMLFDGFLKVYAALKEGEEDRILPDIKENEELKALKVEGEQNFTQPPARFTEASLVKELEEKNIGRPSTYAPIVATLQDRNYISKEKKSLIPTELGFIVIDMMTKYFKEIVDVGFTAQMEDNLDDIEIKGVNWKGVVGDFYGTLKEELDVADREIEKVKFEVELTGETCELCGKPMAVKHGRFGSFAACTGYPECRNTKPLVQTIDVKCPECGKDMVVRRSKKGRVFYGCSGYPDCNKSYWNKPINRKCPKCGELLVEKKGKETNYACGNSECDYKE
ncbi:MAG: type I DNA topoisomerase [Anaerovoracaceae bacterium]|nr:type I DNA topoisomerase [Anaerovoracaceae bacterium]